MNISVAYENTICCFASISFEKIIKGGPEEEILNDQTIDKMSSNSKSLKSFTKSSIGVHK